MSKKKRKKRADVDAELLQAIFNLEKDWKRIQTIEKHSIDKTLESQYAEKIAQARYLFLHREARHRNLSALRF